MIVVDCPEDIAVERLVRDRGFTEADARARMANQASRADRLARASFVIDNSGSREHLDAEVARCWAWLTALPRQPPSSEPACETARFAPLCARRSARACCQRRRTSAGSCQISCSVKGSTRKPARVRAANAARHPRHRGAPCETCRC